MLIQMIVRAIFIYFIFILFKNIWKGYKSIQAVKKGIKDAHKSSHSYGGHGHERQSKYDDGEVVDAKFRVINEEDT